MDCTNSSQLRCDQDVANGTVDDVVVELPMRRLRLSALIIACCVIILGVIGNALIVYIVPRKKDMKTVCNIFVANLAIRDIFFLLTFGGAGIVDHAVYTLHGNELEVMRLISVYTLTVAILATSGLLVALAIDRYQSIGHPLQSRSKKSFYKAHIATAVIWFVSLILPIVHPILRTPDSRLSWLMVVIVNTLVAYVVPLATVGICYVFIIIAVRRGQQVTGESNHLTRWEFKRKIRVLRMVAYVVLLFSLSWGVWWGFNIYLAYEKYKEIPITHKDDIARDITDLIVLLTSAINPFVYGFTDANFNRHLKKMLCWSCAPRSLQYHSSVAKPTGEMISPPQHAEYSIVKRRFSHSNGNSDKISEKSTLRMSMVELESSV